MLCCRCANVLERATGRSVESALALSLATLLLLFPANLMPLLQVAIAGVQRSSRLGSGIIGMWADGWPLLAVVTALQGVVLPFLRFGLLATALGTLRIARHASSAGMLFRWAERLDLWAMPDVFLIGAVVGYSRVAAHLPLLIEPGGWCLVAAAACAMLTRASLDRRAIWRMIQRPAAPPHGPTIACRICDLVVPADMEGGHCPRCRARLYHRQPFSMTRAAALVAARYLLYPVANYFPMSVNLQLGTPHPHTIAGGLEQLLEAGFWALAL